jgi:hypothetical protein
MLRISLGCLEELHAIESIHPPPENNRDDVGNESESSSNDLSSRLDGFAFKERRSRLRRFMFLAILSAIVAASAWDAAVNQDSQTLSWTQQFVIFAPVVVAVVSLILFLMCLNAFTYSIVSKPLIGGIISVILFLIWLVDLLLTMHSADSWAVNEIGEIRMANLYYFSWCSIITAGLIMMSYVESVFGRENKSEMFIVWASNIKGKSL